MLTRAFMIQSVIYEESLVPGSARVATPTATLRLLNSEAGEPLLRLGIDAPNKQIVLQFPAAERPALRPGQRLRLTFSLEEEKGAE